MVPYLLRRDSHAARSIAFNLSAKAGDELFMDERYREAFWMFRLVSYEVQQKPKNTWNISNDYPTTKNGISQIHVA